jgi:hypothetical protein
MPIWIEPFEKTPFDQTLKPVNDIDKLAIKKYMS